jgi:pullulanase
MYSRGGCVRKKTNNQGLVFLEKDWEGDRLPEDLVEESGLMGTSFSILKPNERAKIGGYAKRGDNAQFITDTNDFPFVPKEESKIYLASDMNGWDNCIGNEKWALTPLPDAPALHILNLKWSEVSLLNSFSFKFITDQGQWIEPDSILSCSEQNQVGTRNFLFNSSRTGKDILSFELVEGPGKENLNEWINFRPIGEFGYSKSKIGSRFRVFAPRVSQMELLIKKSIQQKQFDRYSMEKSDDGSWWIEVPIDCEGMYYKYSVQNTKGKGRETFFEKEVVDPYARAMIGRDGPGLALSVEKSEKSTSVDIPKMEDLVILETHIRDLLTHAPLDLTDKERLEFRGLTRWLKSEDCYLKRLGVNAIELQPIHEFDARSKDEYHWGYMSVNFFAPASSYASNPENGSAIYEFKNLVTALHNEKLSVIIDVVYNHVGVPAHLSFLDRELYFSTDENGVLNNHSGCGNDINAESQPVRRLIIDSLLSLVNDFNVDGFRFDLGELLGLRLLAEIETELLKVNPKLILIAEPWSFRGRLPLEINQLKYSLWSDNCREKLLQYVKGHECSSEMIKLLKGRLDEENLYPWQSINYLESHDDFTFIDRLCSHEEWINGSPPEKVVKQAMVAMGLLLLSPGIPMLGSGQDYLRSKRGVQNTYQRGDLNALKYNEFIHTENFHNWTKKLISFRSSQNGTLLRLSEFLPQEEYQTIHGPKNSFGLLIHSNQGGSESSFLLILVNPSEQEIKLSLPDFKNRQSKLILLGEKGADFGSVLPISIQVWKIE